MFRFFHFVPHSLSAQPADFREQTRMFRLWRSKPGVRQKIRTGIPAAREGWGISFYILKRNKRNSGTRQREQGLSPFRTVPHCSALTAAAGRGGRRP